MSVQLTAQQTAQFTAMEASFQRTQTSQFGSLLQSIFQPQAGGLMGALGKELQNLGQALTRIASLLDGKGTPATGGSVTGGTASGTVSSGYQNVRGPGSKTDVNSDRARATDGQVIAGTARIWGDPHFIGADGGKFDVQGEAGKTYNLLSDSGFQMNGRFDKYNNEDGLTVVGQVGITLDNNYVTVNKDGSASVDGIDLKDGVTMQLGNGGSITKDGKWITVKSGEWEVKFEAAGSGAGAHLNMDIKTDNAVADGVKPHGLIGQTFDGDGKARNGDAGKGTQGGGAIEDLNGNITERGNKSAVQLYEVAGIHDYKFTNFNRDTRGLDFNKALMSGSTFNSTYGSASGQSVSSNAFSTLMQQMAEQMSMIARMGTQNTFNQFNFTSFSAQW